MSHIHCCLPLLLALSNTPQKTPDPLAFPWQAFAPRDMGDRDSSLIKTSKVQLLLNGSALMRGLRLVYDRLHAKMLTKMDFSHCSIHCKKETMTYAENWINYCHNVYDESYAHSLCLIFLSVIVCVCVCVSNATIGMCWKMFWKITKESWMELAWSSALDTCRLSMSLLKLWGRAQKTAFLPHCFRLRRNKWHTLHHLACIVVKYIIYIIYIPIHPILSPL